MDDLVIRTSRDCPSPLLLRRRDWRLPEATVAAALARRWITRSVSLTRARSETSPAQWAAWPRPTRSTRR